MMSRVEGLDREVRMPRGGASDGDVVRALRKLVGDGVDAGSYVILNGDAGRNYYIQFAVEKGVLFCEAVHDRFLAPKDRLSAARARRLVALGWQRPGKGHANWYQTFRPRGVDDYRRIVGLVRQAFREVYGLPKKAPIAIECSWDGQALAELSRVAFASEGHRSTWEIVAWCAGQLFGTFVASVGAPVLYVRRRSLEVAIGVQPVGMHSSLIWLSTVVAEGVSPSPGLMARLLAGNRELRFGAASLSADGQVGFSHALVGDSVTREELAVVLPAFLEAASDLRKRLKESPRRAARQ
jgi:hypothetical protein